MNPVQISIEDVKELKKELGTKLPKKVAKQMGTVWQPPHDEIEVENNLMKDPFLIPRFQSKPRVVFTRSKVIGNRDFELKVRP